MFLGNLSPGGSARGSWRGANRPDALLANRDDAHAVAGVNPQTRGLLWRHRNLGSEDDPLPLDCVGLGGGRGLSRVDRNPGSRWRRRRLRRRRLRSGNGHSLALAGSPLAAPAGAGLAVPPAGRAAARGGGGRRELLVAVLRLLRATRGGRAGRASWRAEASAGDEDEREGGESRDSNAFFHGL